MDKLAVKDLFLLEDALKALLDDQRALAGLLEKQRVALAAGDAAALADLCRREKEAVDRIQAVERGRRTLMENLKTSLVRPGAGAEPWSLATLAQCVPEPVRTRLTVRRAELVQVMTRNQKHAATVRSASERLLQHVGGLISTLGSAAQGGAAYGQSGRLTAAPVRLSTLNLSA